MLDVEKTPVDKRKPADSQHGRSPVGLPHRQQSSAQGRRKPRTAAPPELRKIGGVDAWKAGENAATSSLLRIIGWCATSSGDCGINSRPQVQIDHAVAGVPNLPAFYSSNSRSLAAPRWAGPTGSKVLRQPGGRENLPAKDKARGQAASAIPRAAPFSLILALLRGSL